MNRNHGFETTTELLIAAKQLKVEARLVKDRDTHAAWWDNKVDILNVINSYLETGGFSGEAYAELREAKSIIYNAEAQAGAYSMQ